MVNIIKFFGLILIVLLLIIIILSNYLVTYLMCRRGKGGERKNKISEDNYKKIMLLKVEQRKKTNEFLEKHTVNKVSINSIDGFKLVGFCIKQNENINHKWAIVLHGYRESHKKVLDYGRSFFKNGYNVLLPDLRVCGESEGDYIGFGYLEKNDVKNWVNWIVENDDNAEIVIMGRSMGASTVMMYAGIDECEQVKLFIEDSGYSNIYEINKKELKMRFNLPSFPIVNIANLISKIRAGYYFSDVNIVNALRKCEKPMLFIHGTNDDFVPFEMMDVVYNAIDTDKKEKLIIENGEHMDGFYVLGDEYFKKIMSFIRKWG